MIHACRSQSVSMLEWSTFLSLGCNNPGSLMQLFCYNDHLNTPSVIYCFLVDVNSVTGASVQIPRQKDHREVQHKQRSDIKGLFHLKWHCFESFNQKVAAVSIFLIHIYVPSQPPCPVHPLCYHPVPPAAPSFIRFLSVAFTREW